MLLNPLPVMADTEARPPQTLHRHRMDRKPQQCSHPVCTVHGSLAGQPGKPAGVQLHHGPHERCTASDSSTTLPRIPAPCSAAFDKSPFYTSRGEHAM